MDVLNPTLVWFVAGTILALLEFVAPGIILIFFAAGAWIVSFTSWIGLTGSLESQLLLFAVTSAALLVSLRRWIRGKFSGHISGVQDPLRNLDEFTGKTVQVIADVVPGRPGGKVEFKGSTWSAESGEEIKAGEMAVITGIEGISLKVAGKSEGGES
jgi:membrane protein implicated in regulation of membrane protease activity